MENSEVDKQKNSNLSLGLIALNILLTLILASNITAANDPDGIVFLMVLVISATTLLGGYAFTYHGKGYRWAKWLFGVLLIISLGFIGLLWYAAELAAAFKN